MVIERLRTCEYISMGITFSFTSLFNEAVIAVHVQLLCKHSHTHHLLLGILSHMEDGFIPEFFAIDASAQGQSRGSHSFNGMNMTMAIIEPCVCCFVYFSFLRGCFGLLLFF